MRYKKMLAIVASFLVLLSVFANAGKNLYLHAEDNDTNRFNVVVVLDASNSMNSTDPNGYRYEAISLFVNLLTADGNYIGNVVFSNDILDSQSMQEANAQTVKDEFIKELKETKATGYTNIGKSIDTAVDMLKNESDPSLPSVILFLSDGNTEMPNDDQLQESLELKAEAIQEARENNIKIYSVCLNADSSADVSEMMQIAEATGGQFNEVATPEDLVDIFNVFYNMIYGTATIPVGDEILPENGILEKEFELPSFGVEEVNIIIYGLVDDVQVINPNGNTIDSTIIKSDTYVIAKFTDIESGKWKMIANGDPGTRIKINMVYNTNMKVTISSVLPEESISPEDVVEIKAVLESNGTIANQDEQYSGYTAKLKVMDSYRNEIDEIAFPVEDGCFKIQNKFEPGTYYFNVIVNGNYLHKESEEFGPLVVRTMEQEDVNDLSMTNTAPVPVQNPVKKTVYIIPFKDNEYSFNLSDLAKDKEDSKLYYEIVSSSFVQDEDYSRQEDQVKLTRFSLRKGAFTIRAYDSMGEYCDIEVIITSINVGILTLIGVAIIAILVLIGVGVAVWYWGVQRLRGTVTIRAYCNGTVSGGEVSNGHGKIRLSRFQLENIGLNYRSSYIQSTGKKYIYLKTNVPVNGGGSVGKSKKKMIRDGIEVRIYVNDPDKYLTILFRSNINNISGTRGTRGRRTGKRSNGTIKTGTQATNQRKRRR